MPEPVVGKGLVLLGAFGAAWADVHCRLSELGNTVQKAMVRVDRDRVGPDDVHDRIHTHPCLRAQPVPDPPKPHAFDRGDSRGGHQCVLGEGHEIRIDRLSAGSPEAPR